VLGRTLAIPYGDDYKPSSQAMICLATKPSMPKESTKNSTKVHEQHEAAQPEGQAKLGNLFFC
jgi:hypothetical protein